MVHLISARRLSQELGAGAVTATQQAYYVVASFVLWLALTYLLIVPPPNPRIWPLPLGLWFYEGILLVLVYIFGVLYCLGKCRVDPKANFLIDFSCLYTPISLTTLIAVWGLFYIYAFFIPWLLRDLRTESPMIVLQIAYSPRFFDLLRFLAVVGTAFLVLIRVAHHMERVSRLRLSANPTVEWDAPQAARPSP